MSKPRYSWWGYAKSMIRRYPDKDLPNEKAAVEAAIEATKKLETGPDRLKIVKMVFWDRSHSLDGAALAVHVSERTAQRYHADFIREVGRGFRCEGLLNGKVETERRKQSPKVKQCRKLNDKQKRLVMLMAEYNMRQNKAGRAVPMCSSYTWKNMNKIREKTGLDPRNFWDLCALLEMLGVQAGTKTEEVKP